MDDKKVLASFVYFFRNETSFREITREIFLLGLMFNEMSFSINMYNKYKKSKLVFFDYIISKLFFIFDLRNFLFVYNSKNREYIGEVRISVFLSSCFNSIKTMLSLLKFFYLCLFVVHLYIYI